MQNTWQAELEQGIAPETLTGQTLELGAGLRGPSVSGVPTPWLDCRSDGALKDGILTLAAFSRSVVVRIGLK